MFGVLRWLFGGQPRRSSSVRIDGWFLESTVKLPKPIKTTLGGRVSSISATADISYSVEGERIILESVRLARGVATNLASGQRGEAWEGSDGDVPRELLKAATEKDLAATNSRPRKVMLGRWRATHGQSSAVALVDAINMRESASRVAYLLAAAGRGSRIAFRYTNDVGERTDRVVTVDSVRGDSMRALDQDGKFKNFRLDRISDARPA